MITVEEVSNIKSEKIFGKKLKVKKVGEGVFEIIGFNYGEEESRFTGYAGEVAKYLNGYFGLR